MKGERHVGGEIRVLSNLIKRCMDDGMPPETTGMQGWIIGFLHRNEDRDMFQRTWRLNSTSAAPRPPAYCS